MANLSKISREKLISSLEAIKNKQSEKEIINNLNEAINSINNKKYGIVFEEHNEEFEEKFRTHIPILTNINQNKVNRDPNGFWNFLIEGDNLQALHLLEKTHRGKIDVIYIDPPYNTGANDWKYNNDYVGKTDNYKHSKWLSMMKKRLEIAHKLLKSTGILICAIDHFELFQIGLLLDEIFFEANRLGVVSVVHKPEGRNQEKFFATSNEFALFYAKDISKTSFNSVVLSEEKMDEFTLIDSKGKYKLDPLIAKNHGRAGEDKNLRANRPHKFFPIYVSNDCKNITVDFIEGYIKVLPISTQERTWKYDIGKMKDLIKEGEIVAKNNSGKITLFDKYRIEKGELVKTHWIKKEYNANMFGTKILTKIIGGGEFDFPKSLYLIKDILAITMPKNGLVLDFFAGSGTTMHATNLLNKEDGGKRKCILVTNNELSEKEEKELSNQGITKDNPKWEQSGIARKVTWPRIFGAIKGVDINGNPLEGQYEGSNISLAEGFITNAKYLKCDWIERRPKNYLLSTSLVKHVKELIELENSIEIDNKSYVLILNKTDFIKYLVNNKNIKKVWVNQNIVFDDKEYSYLLKQNFKYIPKEYFGEELKEVGE